jgi:hypothetical protein
LFAGTGTDNDDREDGVVKLSLDILRPMFETRLTDAAQELGLSVPSFLPSFRPLLFLSSYTPPLVGWRRFGGAFW